MKSKSTLQAMGIIPTIISGAHIYHTPESVSYWMDELNSSYAFPFSRIDPTDTVLTRAISEANRVIIQ